MLEEYRQLDQTLSEQVTQNVGLVAANRQVQALPPPSLPFSNATTKKLCVHRVLTSTPPLPHQYKIELDDMTLERNDLRCQQERDLQARMDERTQERQETARLHQVLQVR